MSMFSIILIIVLVLVALRLWKKHKGLIVIILAAIGFFVLIQQGLGSVIGSIFRFIGKLF